MPDPREQIRSFFRSIGLRPVAVDGLRSDLVRCRGEAFAQVYDELRDEDDETFASLYEFAHTDIDVHKVMLCLDSERLCTFAKILDTTPGLAPAEVLDVGGGGGALSFWLCRK